MYIYICTYQSILFEFQHRHACGALPPEVGLARAAHHLQQLDVLPDGSGEPTTLAVENPSKPRDFMEFYAGLMGFHGIFMVV